MGSLRLHAGYADTPDLTPRHAHRAHHTYDAHALANWIGFSKTLKQGPYTGASPLRYMAQAVTTQMANTHASTHKQHNKRLNVADLLPGTLVNELYVISHLELREGGKTGRFVTFRAQDATGSVRGVYWPAEPEEAEALVRELDGGHVARIKGDVVSYRDRTEIRVAAPTGGVSSYEGKNVDPAPFVPTSAVGEKELRDAVEVRIGLVADKHLRRLLRAFFADKERADAYFRLPARLHGPHSHIRGLAEEAVEAARIVGAAAGSIPGLDRDLATAAALLAPAGAVLAFNELGLAHEATRAGLLMPHRLLAADLATLAAREATSIPATTVQRLRHVLVREGEVPRWGWSSGPETLLPETVILHHALEMSRRVPEVRAVNERRLQDVE